MQTIKNRKDKIEVWQNLQTDLVIKSKLGTHIVAKNSSHMVNIDRPDVIVQAVHEMVEQLRNK